MSIKQNILSLQNRKDIYKRNMTALKNRDPFIHKKVAECKTCNYKVYKPDNNTIANLIDLQTNKGFYSEHDPIFDVENQIENLKLKNTRIALVLGMGLGYELFYADKVIKPEQKTEYILLIEKDIEIFKVALETTLLTDLIENKRILFMVEKDVEDMFLAFQTFIASGNNMYYMKAFNAIYTNYNIMQSKGYYLQALKLFKSAGLNTVVSTGNCPEDSLNGIRNFFVNIREYLENPGVNLLKDKFKGKPAVVVSTGPSLDKNKHLLKDITDKALIICPDASVKVLKSMGIKPHIITSIERGIETFIFFENLEEEDMEDVYLASLPILVKEIYDKYKKNKIMVPRTLDYFQWTNIDKGYLAVKHSSGNMAYLLGSYLGCNPVILIGQDLAYGEEGVTHASGTEFEREDNQHMNESTREEYKEDDKIIIRKGNVAETVKTNFIWNLFLEDYEIDISQTPQTLCINSTEGGAYIKGTTVMPFKESIEKYIKNKFDAVSIIKENLKPFENENIKETARKLRQKANNTIIELNSIRKAFEKAAEFYVNDKEKLDDLRKNFKAPEDVNERKNLNRYLDNIINNAEKVISKVKQLEAYKSLVIGIMISYETNFMIDINEMPSKYDDEVELKANKVFEYAKYLSFNAAIAGETKFELTKLMERLDF